MWRRLFFSSFLALLALSAAIAGNGAVLIGEYFASNPLSAPHLVHAGDALDRITWIHDLPAWPGDRPGSLTASYESDLPAGWIGFSLPQVLDQDATFTAAVVFVVRSEGFTADPNGFFQISWGLWNSAATGLERTGNFSDFSGDTFELLEFDWFPNVSPFFGGPYLSPSLFGTADVDNPSFPFLGSFTNASFSFGPQIALPFDEPLLALIEHQPDLGTAVVSVHRIVKPRATVPVEGAVAVIDLSVLPLREYALDAVGLTLWHDGFGGPVPAVRADLVFHAVIVQEGLFNEVDDVLRVPPIPQR